MSDPTVPPETPESPETPETADTPSPPETFETPATPAADASPATTTPELVDSVDLPRHDRLAVARLAPSFVTFGLLLALVEGLQLGGVIAQGLAIERSGPQGLAGDVFHRIGYAFLNNVGTVNNLVLIAAVVLVMLPTVAGLDVGPRLSGRQAFTCALASGLALIIGLGAILAVRSRLHVLDLSHQPTGALTARVLYTYLAGTLGTAAVAMVLAMRAIRGTVTASS